MLRPGFELASAKDMKIPQCVDAGAEAVALVEETSQTLACGAAKRFEFLRLLPASRIDFSFTTSPPPNCLIGARFSLHFDAAPQQDRVTFVEVICRNDWKQRRCGRIVCEYFLREHTHVDRSLLVARLAPRD